MAISRLRLTARDRSRLATLAQAISSTISATPLIQVATFESRPACGPRSSCTGPNSPRGRADSTVPHPGSNSAAARQLFWNARVRSLSAAARLTPGCRLTIISSQLQL